MTVTKTLLEFRDPPQQDDEKYRVIHEGPNFILFVTLDEPPATESRTLFGLFATQSLGEPGRGIEISGSPLQAVDVRPYGSRG